MDRRAFLQTAGAAGLATMLSRPLLAVPSDSRYMKTLGLQLYTLRNQLEKDVPKTLKAVADAGYYQVELMRVTDADKLVAAAHDVGLKTTSAMIDWRTIVTPDKPGVPSFDETLATAAKNKLRYLVFGYIGKGNRETADQFKVLAERANRAGEKCKKANIQFCYHHHAFEFETLPNGQMGAEVFMEELDPDLVKFEIDVFWLAIAGRDPVETLYDVAGRVAQVHLKDLARGIGTFLDESKVPAGAFKEVGSGTLDWKAILRAAEAAGADQCHVEQDQSPDPIKSIGQSLKYLKQLG